MSATPLIGLGARELRDRLAAGALRATELARACLDQIRAREPEVRAFAWLDEAHAMREAERLDALRVRGGPTGPLHGLPVGVKDVIDTARIPTENGTPLDAGRVPARDAFVVERLRAAGALMIGKTETAELAFLHPGRTRNPHDPARTPGGSSQGSAAAVAAGMVPLAIGTQTGGSVIRPAAYCGVTGYKPTFGAIPRTGILVQSPSLDTVGVFGRGPEDVALLADALFGHDPADPASQPMPPPRLLETARAEPPVPPVIAVVRPPHWEHATPEMRAAIEELAEALGPQAVRAALPEAFDEAVRMRERINLAEMARAYRGYEARGAAALSAELAGALAQGRAIPAHAYLEALDWRPVLGAALGPIFERADAILMPAAPGPAPVGLASTGSSIFNGLWTLCGLPVVTLPLFRDAEGMPMGAQLVGRAWDDARLLRTARWLAATVGA